MKNPQGNIWVQGAGELASGTAVRLVRCGYRVVMAEIENPLAVRRLVAFSEAVYSGGACVEGICGVLTDTVSVKFRAGVVAVVVDPLGMAMSGLPIDAIVDARLTKKEPEKLSCTDLPVVGLGPGFFCGINADRIVETHRAARMGEVYSYGQAVTNTGIPGPVGGQSALRLVRSPAAGKLSPIVEIGDLVQKDQILGTVENQPIRAQIDGMVRGLIHPKAELIVGEKVGDIDPRGPDVDPRKITDKALAVAGGVVEALLGLGIPPAQFCKTTKNDS